jgi:hypothetical protein
MNFALVGVLAVACGGKDLGTALQWEESIGAAQAQARRENKLVLALHVSGHFDNPGLT